MTEDFIRHIWDMVDYWDARANQSCRDRLQGLAFSILVALDGHAGGFEGSRDDLDWNDMLHEMFYRDDLRRDRPAVTVHSDTTRENG